MIAMSMTSVYDAYRRYRSASAPVCPTPAHPLRRAMAHVLAMIGLGVGGMAAVDNEGKNQISTEPVEHPARAFNGANRP